MSTRSQPHFVLTRETLITTGFFQLLYQIGGVQTKVKQPKSLL